ncbi:MAG: efflux RND transporter permease subunit [Acidobacteriota bacterium]|nr:efflux RND transporter permease subunit [Acidobacteriota bacterium]
MSLTALAIEKNRITLVVLLVILAAGVRAYLGMPQSEDPGFTIRTAMVVTYFPGASPERVELLVTDKIEKAIQEIPEVDVINSQSKNGVSIVIVDIQERYKEMRPIWDNLRRKVDRVRGDLPEGVIGPDVNDEFGDVFGTVINLTGDGYTYAELKDVADDVRDELLLIDEVAKVEIHGAQDERIFVEYNNARLAELGLSPGQLKGILESRNIINPGGQVRTADEEIVLEPSGNFESVADLGRTIISLPGQSELIYLEDVAEIARGYVDPPKRRMHASGRPGLALAVSMREGGSILLLGKEVRATIDRLQAVYPHGVEFEFTQFQAGEVEKKVSDFAGNLIQAVAIVMLVMLVSLGLRTGLVVASLIPMAIVMSFIFMALFDVGINSMSLASLIIALGLLVDNAIVMSESIMVLAAEGKSVKEAAVASAKELKTPLLVSSLTTAAAFLPIYLAKSAVGEYTAALFQVVTITLLCSWLLALTMIPLFCVLFLRVKRKAEGDGYDSRFYRRYRGLLLAALRRPWLSMGVVALVFFATMQLFGLVPAIFFPPNERPSLTAELRLPTGTPLARTEEVVEEVEAFMTANLRAGPEQLAAGEQGVTNWATFIGEGAPRFFLSYGPEQASPEYAILVVNASSREYVDTAVAELREFTKRFPGLKAQIDPLPLGPPAGDPIEVRVSGRDTDTIFEIVDQVKARLAAVAGPRNVSDNWGARSKKLLVKINAARAQRAGVTNEDVAVSLQTVLSGITTTEYREEDKVIPVTLRSVGADRLDLAKLDSLNVFSQVTGRSVPLEQVADLEVAWQPANIRRRDRLRTVTVSADLDPGFTAIAVNEDLVPLLERDREGWPQGYSYEIGGEDEASQEANASIVEQLPIAALIIVMLLVGQFNSIRRGLIILITIPLGVIGVVLGLLVMRSYFGFMTLLGIISLAGIVINNAIVLIDRIEIEIRDKGLTPQQAIVESAQRRLRPIVLTTLTTLGGLIPLYLGGGIMYRPMAVAIMFGLAFATTLTLGVVPVLYTLFFRVRFADFEYRPRG